MRCERAEELFSEYCEGAIQPALRIPFESHLKECVPCRQQVESLSGLWQILAEVPRVEAPSGFRAAVWQRIDAQHSSARQPAWWERFIPSISAPGRERKLAWAGAAVLFLVLAGIVVPGRYNPAGWGRFSASSRNEFIAARPVPIPGGSAVRIPLSLLDYQGKLTTLSAIPVRVRVLGGPVTLDGADSLIVNGPSPAEILLKVDPSAASEPAVIEVRRMDRGEPSTQILTIPIPQS